MQPQVVVSATPYAFGQGSSAHLGQEDPVTQRRPPTPPPPPMQPHMQAAMHASMQPAMPPPVEMSSPLPPPTVPVRQRSSYPDDDFVDGRRASSHPSSHPSSSSHYDDYVVPSRRRVGGWIVALVLMMAVGVVGWVVAKPYLMARTASATVALDPRAQAFINDGERAMSDGNLDAAQEAFDKASALAEHEPRVLVDEARIAAAKADVPWLKTRLLPADAVDDVRATRSELTDRVARARSAADAAMAASPDDPGAIRAHIDALRLAGDRDQARRNVSRIINQASQPETAYVLAALDLAEPEPLWTTLVDRLRLAASGEGGAGRARAALVYALAQSGDVAGAKAELAKLDALARPYPLLPQLRAFVARAPSKASADGGVVAAVPHVDLSSLPMQPMPPAGGGAGAAVAANDPDEAPVPSETGSAMRAAQGAIRKGDWNRARSIYEALVSRNPSDSEALSGLGDVARAQGDTAGALTAYRRALSVNPSYLPSLLGVADTQWASGDHGGALKAYKDIVDRFPEGTYPGYVKTRVEGASSAPTATTVVVPPSSSAAPPAAPTAAPTPAPTPAPKPSTDKDGL
jgi:tetratricopeptide (TPR) repeat protein